MSGWAITGARREAHARVARSLLGEFKFDRRCLVLTGGPWAEGAREILHHGRAMTMLCVLLDDPEARPRVLDEVIKNVGAGLN